MSEPLVAYGSVRCPCGARYRARIDADAGTVTRCPRGCAWPDDETREALVEIVRCAASVAHDEEEPESW